jgi:hypothetical protein
MWKRPWFRSLTPAEKAAWFYIKDECDTVGVWVPDFALAEFQIGDKIDWKKLPSKTNGNIEILPNGKWFLVDFCAFQYGVLKADESNRPHTSYIKLLEHHGLSDRVSIDYEKAINSPKDKDKTKKRKKKNQDYTDSFEKFWKAYPKKVGKGDAARSWNRDELDDRVDEILPVLEQYKQLPQRTKDNGQFIPYPATWLNSKSYDDSPTTSVSAGPSPYSGLKVY